MRRVRLSTLLVSLNVVLLLLAVGGMAIVAVGLLRQLADEQALARVSAAGTTAQQQILSAEDLLLTQAQVLAERPTLLRLMRAHDARDLASYLGQYQQTSQLGGCVALLGDQELATSGVILSLGSLHLAQAQASPRFFVTQTGAPPIMGAWAGVPGEPGGAVVTTRPLDATFARGIEAQINLSVDILDPEAARTSGSADQVALRLRALATGHLVTQRLSDPAAYVAVAPIRAPSGETVGVIETLLRATGTSASLRELSVTLLVLALMVSLVCAAVSFAIGRRLGWPLHRLAMVAARIGRGDLETPVIPPRTGAEVILLARTLDEMRARLLALTADLRRQQAEASAILTGIVEGVFTVDSERRIRYVNPQAAALLGIEPRSAIGRFCGDVLNPQGRDGVRPCEDHCPIVHARFQGGVRATEQLRVADGTRRTVVITSAAPDQGQQVQVLRDETEVEATRRLRDTVLANISHEFKTPLAAQLASIELLLDRLPELSLDDTGQLVLAQQRSTLRLSRLIDNLLESVRIESGRTDIRRQHVALDEVVQDAMELTHPLLAQRQQEASVRLPYPLPPVTGDATRLVQVFVNLLANASKFAPAGSTIGVGGEVTGERVTLWVEDEGPGLPALPDDALFEPFVRATGEEPEQSGMGLGLWIVKSIVDRHGGQVSSTRRPGGGARVRVTLPLAHAPAAVVAGPAESRADGGARDGASG
jgi:signal transduction histidine kinase/HAMP domain-containing protein